MIKKYLSWYFKHLNFMQGLSVISVILFTWLLLNTFIQGQYTIAEIIVWFWGLSIANLVVQYKQSK